MYSCYMPYDIMCYYNILCCLSLSLSLYTYIYMIACDIRGHRDLPGGGPGHGPHHLRGLIIVIVIITVLLIVVIIDHIHMITMPTIV